MTTFYLGGPMRGHDRYNFPAFDRAVDKLRQVDGYVILSPAEHDRETGFDETLNTLDGFDFAAAFAWDLASIGQATGGVIFLPGWERSAGCAAEYAHARSLGRIVYAYRDACDDPDAPYGFKLDPVPVGYTPEVDPLDPNNPEPHVVTLHTEIDIVTDGGSVVWSNKRPGTMKGWVPGIGAVDSPTVEGSSDPAPPNDPDLSYINEYYPSQDGETRVTDPDTGGEKGTKLARFDLIPAGPLWQLAEHYGKGARKYDDDNWRRGYSWRLSFAALMRHAWAFWRGEDIDPETGSHHMTAVAWHAFALVDFADTHPEKDDRP